MSVYLPSSSVAYDDVIRAYRADPYKNPPPCSWQGTQKEEIIPSLHQKHFPARENGRHGSASQICCCVGGYQKQKLIDALEVSNQGMSKALLHFEKTQKASNSKVIRLEGIIQRLEKELTELRFENGELKTLVEAQTKELNDF